MWLFGVLPLLFIHVTAHRRGAPLEACDSMRPGHDKIAPQEGASRHSFMNSKSTVKAGESITVQIKAFSDKDYFLGFFLMAKDEKTNKSIGEFSLDDCEVCKARAIDCHNNKRSAVTHKDNSAKDSIILKWKAPINYVNNTKFKFHYTIVRNYSIFWINEESPPITWLSHASTVTSSWLLMAVALLLLRWNF